ncbi:MAG: hypothetical protein LBB26_03445 [Puniceicoccales bacterium]|jgi:hypothetical protein|nr:hypothetical protein [Puniceicoccales bacterium]
MALSKLAVEPLYIATASYCKENSLVFWQKTGRPPQLPLAAVLTVFIQFTLSRRKDFKAFYCGCDGELLREIFPKMTSYSALLRRLAPIGKILTKFLQIIAGTGFYIVDSASFLSNCPFFLAWLR